MNTKKVPIIKPTEAQLLNVSIVKDIFIIAIISIHKLEKIKSIDKQNKQEFGQYISNNIEL